MARSIMVRTGFVTGMALCTPAWEGSKLGRRWTRTPLGLRGDATGIVTSRLDDEGPIPRVRLRFRGSKRHQTHRRGPPPSSGPPDRAQAAPPHRRPGGSCVVALSTVDAVLPVRLGRAPTTAIAQSPHAALRPTPKPFPPELDRLMTPWGHQGVSRSTFSPRSVRRRRATRSAGRPGPPRAAHGSRRRSCARLRSPRRRSGACGRRRPRATWRAPGRPLPPRPRPRA